MEDRLEFELSQKGLLSEQVDKWREQFRDSQEKFLKVELDLQRVTNEKNHTVEKLMLESVRKREFEE